MPTDTHLENLRMYVNDMAALIKHIEDAIDRQVADARVQTDPTAKALIERLHSTLRGQVKTMENHVAAVGAPAGGAIKEAVASLLGTAAGLYDKVRKHPMSRMLRDDYTALSLASVAYSMLHTTGLAVGELPTANVALRHLKELTPLIMAIGELIPIVVVKELAEDDPSLDQSVAAHARENIVAAWRQAE